MEHDLASGEETTLVDWPALNYDPVYSPDGTEIAFASTITGGWEIYRLGLADGKAHRVTFAGADARYPDYRRPQPLNLSAACGEPDPYRSRGLRRARRRRPCAGT